jgi:hypothetical protein
MLGAFSKMSVSILVLLGWALLLITIRDHVQKNKSSTVPIRNQIATLHQQHMPLVSFSISNQLLMLFHKCWTVSSNVFNPKAHFVWIQRTISSEHKRNRKYQITSEFFNYVKREDPNFSVLWKERQNILRKNYVRKNLGEMSSISS